MSSETKPKAQIGAGMSRNRARVDLSSWLSFMRIPAFREHNVHPKASKLMRSLTAKLATGPTRNFNHCAVGGGRIHWRPYNEETRNCRDDRPYAGRLFAASGTRGHWRRN